MDINEKKKYKTFWNRLIAGIVDGLVLLPISIIDRFVFTPEIDLVIIMPWLIISYSAFFIYSVYFHWKTGQTIGKKFMNIKVKDISEDRGLSLKQAFLRDSVYIVLQTIGTVLIILNIMKLGLFSYSGLQPYDTYLANLALLWFLLEIVSMFTNEKRRAVHDYIANTVVIKVEENQ